MQPPKVTLGGKRTMALLDAAGLGSLQDILKIDLANIKMDSTSKVEGAIAEMMCVCV